MSITSTYDSDNDIYRAIKAGAKGYLLKDARREELLGCIRKVNGGENLSLTLGQRFAADARYQLLHQPLRYTGFILFPPWFLLKLSWRPRGACARSAPIPTSNAPISAPRMP